ncbi:hypothetical protein [Gordonia rhizosphera]|uniref:hypothetical protein n=1 Tax=Gordonia rhizosphera TaxID=83341 RepID=UPI0014616404|nr:hypothetical protein [Gordonia rhizosphera]
MPAPIDQSVIDMLQHSALGPILDTPVSDVLAGMGLPPMPQFPAVLPPAMPGLPPFPTINIEHLFKPLTDLAQSFGSGDLGASGFDPTMLFTGLSSIMQSMIGLSTGALKAADQVWQGQAATAAATKSATAAAQGGMVAQKSTSIAANTQTGAVVVGNGNAAMQAVIAKFQLQAGVAIAAIGTPAGLPLLLTAAGEALAEAIAIVTGTKTALAPETAQQTANGAQIPITGAPTSPSPFGVAATVLESVGQPLSGFSSSGMSMMGSLTKQLTAASKSKHDQFGASEKGATTPATLHGGALGAGGIGGGTGGKKGGAGGGGGIGGLGMAGTPLQGRPGAPNLAVASVEGTTTPSSSSLSGRTVSTTTGGGMMPMGGAAGAAGAAGARGADDGHGAPDFLVTADHGSEVVGAMPQAAPPVLGGDADVEVDSPDVDLRL